MSGILSTLGGGPLVVTTNGELSPVVVAAEDGKKNKPKPEPTEGLNDVKVVKPQEEPSIPVVEAAAPVATGKFTIEQCRAIVVTKAGEGKRDDVKKILTELGADNVTSLTPDKYEEFYNRVSAL